MTLKVGNTTFDLHKPRVGKNGSSYSKGNSGKGNTSQSRDQYTQAGQRGKTLINNANAGSVERLGI